MKTTKLSPLSLVPILTATVLLSSCAGLKLQSTRSTSCPTRQPACATVAQEAAPVGEPDDSEQLTKYRCPSVEDAQESLRALRQLSRKFASMLRTLRTKEGSSKAAAFADLSQWQTELAVWQKHNDERLHSCEPQLNAHGEATEGFARVPTTFENLKKAGGWLQISAANLSAGRKRTSRAFLKAANSAIKMAHRVITKRADRESIIEEPEYLSKFEPTVFPMGTI